MRELRAQPSRAVFSALAVLESFDDANPSQSLASISRRLGIPKATALRTLRALEVKGYVTLNETEGTYSLAVGVLTLAQRYLTRYEALAVARPILAQIAAETGETAHFGVLQGTEVIYLEIAESPQRVRAYVVRGDHLPAHCVAAGKAILAHADAAIVDAFVAAGLPRLTPATIVREKDFLADLRVTHQRGYALNVGEWMEDVAGVSAPVIGHLGTVQGAVGVAGPRSRLNARNVHQIGRLVRRYANGISKKLGGLLAA
jgi:IclR family transcriptional regulator, KDG regulon repressor